MALLIIFFSRATKTTEYSTLLQVLKPIDRDEVIGVVDVHVGGLHTFIVYCHKE